MKGTKYGNIKVPTGLLKEVDKIVKDEGLGYTNRNQFCVNAIRIMKESYMINNQHKKCEEKKP